MRTLYCELRSIWITSLKSIETSLNNDIVWTLAQMISVSLWPEEPTLKTSDFTFYIGSTATFLYFDLYLYIAYAAHYISCFSLTKGQRLKR